LGQILPFDEAYFTFWRCQEFYLCQFRVLKKWGDRLCWGPGTKPERAGSIGWVSPCLLRIKARFLRRRRGVFSPPHLRRNQRLMIPSVPVWSPGPGIPWPWRHTFLQRTKALLLFLFVAVISLCPRCSLWLKSLRFF
jgi:hypothetical protein